MAVATFITWLLMWHRVDVHGPVTLVGDAMHLDKMGVWVGITISVAVFLFALLSDDYLRREGIDGPEHYVLAMLAAIGGMVMGTANDLIVLFLGLEILSIALYVMAASHRRRIQSQESGLKYFILGGFSSAFFLYGIAMIYGATGTTKLRGVDSVKTYLVSNIELGKHRALLLVGVALLLVGLAFKVAAVPFHSWTPDVYQGAPTSITAFMAAATKVAAFGALLRLTYVAFYGMSWDLAPVLWTVAGLTMLVTALG